MGKIENMLKLDEEEEQPNPLKSSPILLSSDDDEEANQDLSLKIVEESVLRACNNNQNDAHFDLSQSSLLQAAAEVVRDDKKDKLKKDEMKNKGVVAEFDSVVVDEEVEKAGEPEVLDIYKLVEGKVDISDNIVLRKLLRGPRYFDPPDSSWGACYNCGEEGHTTVNCTSAKRRRPCFVCGSLEHNVKQCTKFYGRLEYPVTMVLSLRVATVESNGEQSEEDNDFLDHLRSFEKENLRVITVVEIQKLGLEHKKLVINYFVYHEQIGLVADYENSFLELKLRAQVWNKGKFDEKWVVSILVRGQKEEIKDYVKLCCPDSLHRAIVLAKWQELCVTNKVFYERAKRDTSQDGLQLGKLIEEAKVTRNNGKEASGESATNYVKDNIGYLISFNVVDNLSIVSIKLDKQAFDAKQKVVHVYDDFYKVASSSCKEAERLVGSWVYLLPLRVQLP